MDVSQAVAAAKRRFVEVFKDEHVENVGLEEVEGTEDSGWYITLGFNRPYVLAGLAVQLVPTANRPRDYKIVHVSKDGELLSIKNREVP